MSVSVERGIIRLSGACGVEDAEPLLVALQDGAVEVDLCAVTRLHAAVVQLLVAAQLHVATPPADPFLAGLVLPLIQNVARR